MSKPGDIGPPPPGVELTALLRGAKRATAVARALLEQAVDAATAMVAVILQDGDKVAGHSGTSAGMKFRLLLTVMIVVLALSAVKALVHGLGLEFLTLNPLVTSAIGGAIFLIGFLLSGVLADYKESERLPGEIRVMLEALNDDIAAFCARSGKVDASEARRALLRVVAKLRAGLGQGGGDNAEMMPVLAEIDGLAGIIDRLEQAGMAANMIVRLKNTVDGLRRCMFRIYQVQATQFVPSVHILVQTLVGAILFLLLFLITEGTFQSALFFGFIAYIFVYALYLIEMLEQPFRKGTGSLDDVSLFLLYEFADKLRALDTGTAAAPAHGEGNGASPPAHTDGPA